MPTFTGTEKEWRIIIRALVMLSENLKIDKNILPQDWQDMTLDEINKLYSEIAYVKE